jgi:hypothetical protein
MPPRPPRPRGGLRGRFWLIVWLAFALGILAWVDTRQAASVVLARTLQDARAARAAAEAERAALVRRLRDAGSREVLVPKAEALGLRQAADTEIVTLRVTRER